MSPEFRAGERVVSVKICCTECGGPASGDNAWSDGSGYICDACVEADEQAAAAKRRATELSREIARVTSHDPCIMMGCVHEYGHTGQHEYDTPDQKTC